MTNVPDRSTQDTLVGNDPTVTDLVGEAIAQSYRDLPQSADEDDAAMANAIALTEAEPW